MQEKLGPFTKLRQQVEAGGGQKKIDKHCKRERQAGNGSTSFMIRPFREIDVFAATTDDFNKVNGEGVTCGYGTIAGRRVYIFSQDLPLSAAPWDGSCCKICKVLDMAMKVGAPVIGICDRAEPHSKRGRP